MSENAEAPALPGATLPAWQVVLRMVRFRFWYWLVDLVCVLLIRRCQ